MQAIGLNIAEAAQRTRLKVAAGSKIQSDTISLRSRNLWFIYGKPSRVSTSIN
jgi:hypothetical protein